MYSSRVMKSTEATMNELNDETLYLDRRMGSFFSTHSQVIKIPNILINQIVYLSS